MTNIANLFIVSAPSGAGKTSLMDAVISELTDIKLSISHTTREKRPSEQDGEHYFFITEQDFNQKKEAGLFIETAMVFNNYYGTLTKNIEDNLKKGIDTILEIDWQGAKQIKEKYQEAISIFILPPSKEILNKRLTDRKQDSSEVIQHRMEKAKTEISHFKEYDYLVVNDDFTTAKKQIKSIIMSSRLKTKIQTEKLTKLINSYK